MLLSSEKLQIRWKTRFFGQNCKSFYFQNVSVWLHFSYFYENSKSYLEKASKTLKIKVFWTRLQRLLPFQIALFSLFFSIFMKILKATCTTFPNCAFFSQICCFSSIQKLTFCSIWSLKNDRSKKLRLLLKRKWSRKWSHTNMIAGKKAETKDLKMIDHFSVQGVN